MTSNESDTLYPKRSHIYCLLCVGVVVSSYQEKERTNNNKIEGYMWKGHENCAFVPNADEVSR